MIYVFALNTKRDVEESLSYIFYKITLNGDFLFIYDFDGLYGSCVCSIVLFPAKKKLL